MAVQEPVLFVLVIIQCTVVLIANQCREHAGETKVSDEIERQKDEIKKQQEKIKAFVDIIAAGIESDKNMYSCSGVMKGSHHDYPGTSCKDIRDSTNTHKNGEYWIDPVGKGYPFKVYCDMTTDGGGWLLVLNVVIGSSAPSQLFNVTSYRQISGYRSNKMVITKSAMRELRHFLPYTQLRFHCSKQHGRTFHVTTAANSTGKAVVQYFSGQTDVLPDSCGSFARIADDNSRLASLCHRWGIENNVRNVGKWSTNRPRDEWAYSEEERLTSHPAFIPEKFVWLLKPTIKRLECDDRKDPESPGDFWKIFVR